MKKKAFSTLCVAAIAAVSMCVGAFAAGGLQQIKAYINRDITIKLDGQVKTMADEQGARVYPISYDGTTYVPIRAVSSMLGIDVAWDQASYSVLLGKTGTAKDFIETFEPYSKKGGCTDYQISDSRRETIAGKQYDHYISFYGYSVDNRLYYDLGGDYKTLSFDAYFDSTYDDPATIYVYGDNDTLLATYDIVGSNLPTSYSVDVRGVQQLVIKAEIHGALLYLFNATIE